MLTTSCTDLTEDIVPNSTVDNIELILDDGSTDKTDPPVDGDTGGTGNDNDGGKGN